MTYPEGVRDRDSVCFHIFIQNVGERSYLVWCFDGACRSISHKHTRLIFDFWCGVWCCSDYIYIFCLHLCFYILYLWLVWCVVMWWLYLYIYIYIVFVYILHLCDAIQIPPLPPRPPSVLSLPSTCNQSAITNNIVVTHHRHHHYHNHHRRPDYHYQHQKKKQWNSQSVGSHQHPHHPIATITTTYLLLSSSPLPPTSLPSHYIIPYHN